MLLNQDARRKALDGIAVQNRYGGLGDNWPGVHIGCDDMHRAATDLDARRERVRLGPGRHTSREGWQQRWMNIEDAVGIRFDDAGIQNALVASQRNRLYVRFLKRRDDSG